MSYNAVTINAKSGVYTAYTLPAAKKEGYTLTYNKVWSKNTGRSANATMLGDIVAVKRTIIYKIDRMTENEVKEISSRFDTSTAFHSITFYNPKTKQSETGTFYSADFSYTIEKCLKSGNTYTPRYKDIQIELIEQ